MLLLHASLRSSCTASFQQCCRAQQGLIRHHIFSPNCSVEDWLGGNSVGDCGSPVGAGGVACDVHGVCHNHLSVLHIIFHDNNLQ